MRTYEYPVLLRWPWALWSDESDTLILSVDRTIQCSGGNFIAQPGHSRQNIHAEPIRKKVDARNPQSLFDLAHATKDSGSFQFRIDQNSTLTLGGLTKKSLTFDEANLSYVDHWANFFEELYYARSKLDRNEDRYSWNDIKEFIETSVESPKDARLALIVEISERFGSEKFGFDIVETVRGMRSRLNRERTLQDIAQAKEFDSESMKWIAKNPGDTLLQKVGAKRKVLAVRRFSNFDTFENRVLKDFLNRCRVEAIRYLKKTETYFSSSKRVKSVRSFRQTCETALRDERFHKVGVPNLESPPNYVVLHNSRYKEVWKYYLRILRLQEERDDLWRWQNRTWGEITRLLVSVCLYRLADAQTSTFSYELRSLLEGEPILNHQQIHGLRLVEGSEPGPFQLTTKAGRRFVVDVVSSEQAMEHPLTLDLDSLGARVFLIFNAVDGQNFPTQIIAVWSINCVGCESEFPQTEASESVDRALSNVNRRFKNHEVPRNISGLVFSNGAKRFEFTKGRVHYLVNCPENYHLWGKGLREDLPLVLDDLIEGFETQ